MPQRPQEPQGWLSILNVAVHDLPTLPNYPFPQAAISSFSWENPLEKGMAAHSSILAWRIPWTV